MIALFSGRKSVSALCRSLQGVDLALLTNIENVLKLAILAQGSRVVNSSQSLLLQLSFSLAVVADCSLLSNLHGTRSAKGTLLGCACRHSDIEVVNVQYSNMSE